MQLKNYLLVAGTGLLILSCSQKSVENKLEDKVSSQSKVSDSKELQGEVKDLIDDSHLQAQQKTQLRTLQANTDAQLQNFREESLKLRAVLIKDVLSTKKYDRSEVLLIQRKMENIEKQRLALIFKVIDQANKIMGRETDSEESERIMNHAIFTHDSVGHDNFTHDNY